MWLSLCWCYIYRILLSFQEGIDSEGIEEFKYVYILDTGPLREMQMYFECLIYFGSKIHIFEQSCHDNPS